MTPQKLYRCLHDEPNHTSLNAARTCCGSTEALWQCDTCGSVYGDQGQAEDCCQEMEL